MEPDCGFLICARAIRIGFNHCVIQGICMKGLGDHPQSFRPEPSGGTVKTLKLKTIQPRFNLSGDRVSASLNQKMTKTIRFTLDTLACPK